MNELGASLRRAFLAVVPPPDVVAALDVALDRARDVAPPGVSWSRSSQSHVTLQFLGAVTDVDAVVAAVSVAVRDVDVFAARLGGAGAFPSPARASVVWVGLDAGGDDMAALAARVAAATEPLGYPLESRAFTPHVTVARARRPRPVGPALAAIGDGPVGRRWDVHEVVLFESDTHPTGAVHREIATMELGAVGPE